VCVNVVKTGPTGSTVNRTCIRSEQPPKPLCVRTGFETRKPALNR
ncbi:hypothetical protein A2U01_0054274, partial [Trifolium medium]|nr:hypothetical protein [Trifolium medium]